MSTWFEVWPCTMLPLQAACLVFYTTIVRWYLQADGYSVGLCPVQLFNMHAYDSMEDVMKLYDLCCLSHPGLGSSSNPPH